MSGGLGNLIIRWAGDVRGLRKLEKKCGAQGDWIEALHFKIAAETMETALREVRVVWNEKKAPQHPDAEAREEENL